MPAAQVQISEIPEDTSRTGDAGQTSRPSSRPPAQRSAELVALVLDDAQSPLLVALARLDALAGDPTVTAEVATGLRELQEVIEASRALVLDFVDVSSSEAGGLSPRIERSDVGRLLADACMSVSASARRRRQSVLPTNGLRGAAWFDPRLTRRVLKNLLGHAIQNAPEGSTISVQTRPSGNGIEVRVEYDGVPVPEEVRRGAFDRYAKLDQPHSSIRQSPGLSLHFCRVAVEAMRGRIWMESSERGGQSLCFTVPEH